MMKVNNIYNRLRLLAVACVVLVVQLAEILLLERKYDLFSGGFLQPYSYVSLGERLQFAVLSLSTDLFLFGVLGVAWFRIADRMGQRKTLSAYNYFFVCVVLMLGWLAIKYRVLSYFNNTLNFALIKILGGGSLLNAFQYVAHELLVIPLSLLLLSVIYVLGLRVERRIGFSIDERKPAGDKRRVWPMLAAGLATILLVTAVVNRTPELRYGMGKKTSFHLLSYLLDSMTDVDRDGYGSFDHPADNRPLDPEIYPGALDIPDNGIDEDGFGGDFITAGRGADPLRDLTAVSGSHIVLFVLESARWDLIGKSLDGKAVAPHITRLAAEGSAVPYAYSHTGYTTTSIKAIFNRTLSRDRDRMTLVDYLRQAGYNLSFLSSQDESFGGIAGSVGMDAEDAYLFDARKAVEERVHPSANPAGLALGGKRLLEEFRKRAGELDWDRPQFIYVNLQSAHFPYSYPEMQALVNHNPIPRAEISAVNRDWLEATYWNAIANADWAVGMMLNELRDQGAYDDTVVVILGDHSESLFEDNFLGHGHALNESQTRIPLVINRAGIDIRQAVGLMDIAEIAVRAATGRFYPDAWQDEEHGVFQLVGHLHRPQLIGTVRYDEVRTVLDLKERKVFFSDSGEWLDFDVALRKRHLEGRVRDLLYQWEQRRWQDYTSRKKTS